MKHNVRTQHLVSALFAFVLAVSSIGNLITGYDLPVDAMWRIWLWCAFAAAVVAVLFLVPHGGKIILGLAALTVFVLCLAELLQPGIEKQLETLCYLISAHHHKVYNLPILGTETTNDVSVPLILWGALVAFCVNWYVCRRKHIAVAIIPAVAPLVLCLTTTDKVPNAAFLFLLIAGLAILLATDFTRKKQPTYSTKLVLRFTLPIIIFFGLLFICNPKVNYVNHAGRMQKELTMLLEDMQDAVVSVITGTPMDGSADEKLNLRTVGSRSNSTRSVMAVNSPMDGMLYLRERDYDVYTGTVWEASVERTEKFTAGTKSVGTLTIYTYSTRSNLLVPYYATTQIQLVDGALENSENLQQYSYAVSKSLSKKTPLPSDQYTALPDETKAWAKALTDDITNVADTTQEKITKIQNYVRNSATYDTSAARMGSSYSDFAQWFLEESESGYCIHYATAATVLLRAAGIPARYVEGYIVNCEAGKHTVVSKQEAHAWVEYYDRDARAWCILEATPVYPVTERPDVVPSTPQSSGSVAVKPEPIPEETTPEKDPTSENTPGDSSSENMPTTPADAQPPKDSPDDITPNPEKTPWKMPIWMKIILAGLFLVFCVWMQGYARIGRKRKRWDRGAPNARTIWRWRQTRSIAKSLKQLYPKALDDLAQKARFSQHEMQPEELQQFENYRLHLVGLIAKKPWYRRAIFKWILAMDW